MRSASAQLRRFVTLVLVAAAAAFVLHGASPAGMHFHVPFAAASNLAEHQGVSEHHHGDGVLHVHPKDGPSIVADGSDPTGSPEGPDGASGGQACAVVLLASAIPSSASPSTPSAVLVPLNEAGAGMHQSGFKRPPRTRCIA